MINILAVDDDLDFQEILKIKLNTSELNLVLSSSEKEFFEKIDSQKFDIFLLDLSIDDHPLKGLEILIRIRQEKLKDIPIIVLSNSSSKKIISNALELGANDFVSKPVDAKLLVSKIKALVAGKQAFAKELEFGKIPGNAPDIFITSKLHLMAITEMGFLVKGNAYVAKGTKLKLRSSLLKDIFGLDTLDVYSTGFNSEVSGEYVTTFEIDPNNKEIVNKAKLWIKANKT
jgi:CheY-like chemotaxis protein